MKKFLTAFAAGMVMAASLTAYVTAADSVKQQNVPAVILSSNEAQDSKYIAIENGQALVPLRTAAEALGAEVEWNPDLKEITCRTDDKILRFKINNDNVEVTDASNSGCTSIYTLITDVPAKIINGLTYIPINVISEGFGAEIEWNEATKTATIYLEEKASEKQENTENSSPSLAPENSIQEVEADDGTVILRTEIQPLVINSDGKGVEIIENSYKEEAQKEVKNFIETLGQEAESYYKALAADGSADDMIAAGGLPWVLNIENEVTYIDDEKISVLKTIYENTGGAHPMTTLSGAIYDLKTGKKLTLKDIFGDDSEILKKAENGFKQMIKDDPDSYFEDVFDTLDINKANYYINEDGYTFFYNRYEIAPYARGLVSYTIENEA